MEPEGVTIPSKTPPEEDSSSAVDVATIVAISLIVYTCSSFLHEAIGHGVICVLLGGKVACIASTVCIPGDQPISEAASRVVAAGGTITNLIAAAFFWALLRRRKFRSPLWRYFVWLSMAVNGFIGAGYLAVPTLIGFGDWMNVLKGLHPYWALRLGIVAVGILLYVVIYCVAATELKPLLGREHSQRRRRALKLTLVPYFAGGLAFCLAGALNPVGMKLVVISAAAASFGGTAGLAWLAPWVGGSRNLDQLPESAVEMKRSWIWIVAGLVSGALLIFVLGPGVRFRV
jgi:hypothetical protein